jgi:hypothetical protein
VLDGPGFEVFDGGKDVFAGDAIRNHQSRPFSGVSETPFRLPFSGIP